MKNIVIFVLAEYFTNFKRRIPAATARKFESQLKLLVEPSPSAREAYAAARDAARARRAGMKRMKPGRAGGGTIVKSKYVQHIPCAVARKLQADAERRGIPYADVLSEYEAAHGIDGL